MTIGAIAQDKSVKLPVPDAGGEAGTEDDAGGFMKLMAGLLGGGNAQDGEMSAAATLEVDADGIVAATGDGPVVGADAGDGKTGVRTDAVVTTSVGAVNLLLSQLASGEIKLDLAIKTDEAATGVDAPAAADPSMIVSLQAALAGMLQDARGGDVATDGEVKSDIVLLAQAIAKSASETQGVAADAGAATATDGAEMRGVKATLEAWANGPSAIASPTTGAQEKAPMQLAVVGVATHFAPAKMADGSVAKVEVKAGAEDVLPEAAAEQRPTVAAPAAATAAQTGDKEPGDGGDKRETAHANGDVAVQVTAETPDPVIVAMGARVDGAMPVTKQVAQQVVSSLQGQQTVSSLPGDAKPALSKLKILHIQLQPENLGSVTVRMELRADMLELRIDAQKAETAELLRRDREVLSSLMKAAGYSADDANIRVTHGDPVMAQLTPAVSDSGSTQSGASQNGSQSTGERAASSQGRDGGGRREQPRGQAPRDAERAAPSPRAAGPGIYL